MNSTTAHDPKNITHRYILLGFNVVDGKPLQPTMTPYLVKIAIAAEDLTFV